MMRVLVWFSIFIFISTSAFCEMKVDADDLGPAEFYFQQYVHEPWREDESLRQLARKSLELTAATVIVSGFLSMKKRRT